MTPLDIDAAFLDAAAKRGLLIRSLIADGRWHRCDVQGKGKSGKNDGSYRLHAEGTPPHGYIKNHKDGHGLEHWKADAPAVLTPGERAALKAEAERKRREREAERAALAEEAARRAADFWARSIEANPAHPYLVRKDIFPHGVRQLGERLLVPMKAAGALRGLQWISADGDKNYLKGTPKEGCAFRIGTLTSAVAIVAIAEGFATAASVHEATGFGTLAAFDADNLLHVARLARARMPSARIVICGDDDWMTKGNPGRTKAIEAAAAVGGIAIFPAFGADRGERDTDFNDMAARYGLEAVRRQIEEALQMS